MKMSMRHTITCLAIALVLGCGPGGVADDTQDPPPEPEWAYGWWMNSGGPNLHNEWGAYILQMEIRPDGTAFQIVDYCNGPDWTYESRWEVQPDSSIRILPRAGDDGVPFQTAEGSTFKYFDILPNNGSCMAQVILTGFVNTIPGGELEQGRWCIGEYLPEFDECAPEKYCGEEPPVCE
jgi:hypothetical protein